MPSDVHKQWLLIKAGVSLAAVSAAVPDDAADSNTVTDTWEQAGREHAGVMCVIHTDDDSAAEHSVHDLAVWQRDAAQDDSISMQMTKEKTKQWQQWWW